MASRFFRSLPFVLLAVAISTQAQIVGGTIAGVVHDPTGATVSDATVTVKQIETGTTRTLTTDSEGRFFAPSVPVGPYTVEVQHEGFAAQKQTGITLTVGQSFQLNFVLSVAAVEQAVEVDASDPGVNTTTQQTAGLVDERQVKELPLNGRSYDELLTLNPAHRELHRRALRRHRHLQFFGRQHVRRQRPPPAGQSLPAQWH